MYGYGAGCENYVKVPNQVKNPTQLSGEERELPGPCAHPGSFVPASSHDGAVRPQSLMPARRVSYVKDRSRRLFVTTKTDENAIAAPAIIGSSSPATASGMAATL